MRTILTGLTREQVIEFCDNLKESLLTAIDIGTPVAVSSEVDTDPIRDSEGTLDHICQGQTTSIYSGRPALRVEAEYHATIIDEKR